VRTDVAAITSPACAGRRVLDNTPSVVSPRIWLVDKPDAQSVAISMGMHIGVERGDPDYPALVLATTYLGQHRQFVGRLMQKMRGDRGLNYGDYAYAEHFVQDGWGSFPKPNTSRRQQYFSIWIRPVRPVQAHFALRMAVRELRLFAENGMTQADFERVRTFADRYYALFLQTESRRLGYAIDDRFHVADAAYLESLRTAWRALTVEEVNAAIRRHVHPERLQIAIVTKDAAALADRLASEEPSPIEYAAEPTAAVSEEDREIVPYRVGIPRDRMTIVPVGQTFR
jgi:zinc protease